MRNSNEMLAEKDKTPPPIELPPFMVALGSLPPLTEEVAVIARTQLGAHFATLSSPDEAAAFSRSLTALKILIGYYGRWLGVWHNLFKQLVYPPDEPTEFRMPREPFRFPFAVQSITDAIPALSALSALPPLSSLSPDITQYLATIGDNLYQREFHERLFYDLRRIKSVLAPYFNLVAALSKQQPKKGRQAPKSRTPLQILAQRYVLNDNERDFYQELADAGETGIVIDPATDQRHSRLLIDLMRKLPRSYFDLRRPQHYCLSTLGLQQLELT